MEGAARRGLWRWLWWREQKIFSSRHFTLPAIRALTTTDYGLVKTSLNLSIRQPSQ